MWLDVKTLNYTEFHESDESCKVSYLGKVNCSNPINILTRTSSVKNAPVYNKMMEDQREGLKVPLEATKQPSEKRDSGAQRRGGILQEL